MSDLAFSLSCALSSGFQYQSGKYFCITCLKIKYSECNCLVSCVSCSPLVWICLSRILQVGVGHVSEMCVDECSGASSPALVMSDTELKRQQHIRELIDTEEKYVKDLDVVIEVCCRLSSITLYFMSS